MKLTISVLSILFSLQTMAANKIETKYKTISSITIGVEDCSGPYMHEVWAPVVIPSGGDVSVTTSTTTVVANAYFNEVKCTTAETYLEKTTGIDWLGTKKITEVPGSRKRISRVEKTLKNIQLAHAIFEYKFENLALEFQRVRSVLSEKVSAACLTQNQTAQAKALDISNTDCQGN